MPPKFAFIETVINLTKEEVIASLRVEACDDDIISGDFVDGSAISSKFIFLRHCLCTKNHLQANLNHSLKPPRSLRSQRRKRIRAICVN